MKAVLSTIHSVMMCGGMSAACTAHDTQRYEEVDKGVHDEQFDAVREALPAGATLPVEEQLLKAKPQYLLDAQLASQTPTTNTCACAFTDSNHAQRSRRQTPRPKN